MIKFKKKENINHLSIYADKKLVAKIDWQVIIDLVMVHGLELSIVAFDVVFTHKSLHNNPLKDDVRYVELETNYFEVI